MISEHQGCDLQESCYLARYASTDIRLLAYTHAMQGSVQTITVQEDKARGLASRLGNACQLTLAKLSTTSSAYMSDPASLSQCFTVTALALAICSDAFSVTSAYGKSYLYLNQSIQG